MNEVAVVILNYNGRSFLEQFLPGVIKHSVYAKVVVADNLSSDDSVVFLQQNYPEVQVLELSENGGYSKGYNEALKLLDSKYFVLLNSDVEVSPNWLTPIIHMMEEDDEIAAAQPKILDFKRRSHFEYAGAAGGFIDILGYPFCRGRLFQSLEEDTKQYNDVRQVFWATGACLFVRSSDFKNAGGLDPDFFAHMEEIDLCWRLNLMGKKVMYNGLSHVYHVGGGTLEKTNPKKTYLNFRNGLAMLYKNYTFKQLLVNFPIRIILDLVAALKFSMFDGVQNGVAVLKAQLHFLFEIGKLQRKRKEVAKLRNKTSASLYRYSVVYQHFVRGIKDYNRLKD